MIRRLPRKRARPKDPSIPTEPPPSEKPPRGKEWKWENTLIGWTWIAVPIDPNKPRPKPEKKKRTKPWDFSYMKWD
ncbi:MAG: hypothetical protein AB7O60_03640 [Variibacter sp.]